MRLTAPQSIAPYQHSTRISFVSGWRNPDAKRSLSGHGPQWLGLVPLIENVNQGNFTFVAPVRCRNCPVGPRYSGENVIE